MASMRHGPVSWFERMSLGHYLLIAVAIIAIQVLVLFSFGLPAICRCGYVALWHGNPSDAGTSQHLTDWYTYTHVIHGFGFYLLLWIVAPRMPIGLRLALAVGLEAAWEIVENTQFVMERYREGALARGYFGDSVINSVSDTLAMATGFALARTLPVWLIAVATVGMEAFAAYMIRDGLALNIIQLIFASDVISRWQAGG